MEQMNIKTMFENHFIDDWYNKILCNAILDKIKTHHKFRCLNDILSNIFLNETKKQEIVSIFCNVQKFIHAIYRLKHLWKWKRANVYNTEDLFMNPIHVGQKNTIVLLQNNTKYVFHIRELISSVNTSLSNCCHFFLEPLTCKNPHTNLPFDKSSLYNIYFAIRESTFIMPSIMHEYFLSDFHLSNFAINNEHMLNEEYLRTFVNNNCMEDVRETVSDMFKEHGISLKIHREFPHDKLLHIMKPYLHLYYVSNYSLVEYQKMRHHKMLDKKLLKFVKYNPTFGRKKCRMIDLKPFSKEKIVDSYFDDNHVSFNKSGFNYDNHVFMNSHLYKTEFYDRHMSNVYSIGQINRFSRREIMADAASTDFGSDLNDGSDSDDGLNNDVSQLYLHESDSEETIILENSDDE